jgi:hypothetical protein
MMAATTLDERVTGVCPMAGMCWGRGRRAWPRTGREARARLRAVRVLRACVDRGLARSGDLAGSAAAAALLLVAGHGTIVAEFFDAGSPGRWRGRRQPLWWRRDDCARRAYGCSSVMASDASIARWVTFLFAILARFGGRLTRDAARQETS